MPNRILKESVCISGKIDELSWFEEVLFYRLMVNCDDFGRFDGRPAVVRSRCFGLKTDMSMDMVNQGLDKLSDMGLLAFYTVENQRYLFLKGWENHQKIRTRREKFPPPPEDVRTKSANCCQNPIQSETELESEIKSEAELHAAAFDAFWTVYPVHIRKDRARKAFAAANVPVQVMIDAVEEQKNSHLWQKENGRFIPNPDTWLRNRRWEDKLPQTIPKGASGKLGEAEWEAIEKALKEVPHGES